MSDCEFYRELIEQNLSGECSEEEILLLNEHLKECPSCKEEAKFAFKIQNTLRSLPKIEAPDNFLMSLNEKLDLEDKLNAETPDIKFNRFVSSWKKYSALTACLLLAVLVKINIWNIPDSANTDEAAIDDVNNVTVSQIAPEASNEVQISPEIPEVAEEIISQTPVSFQNLIKQEPPAPVKVQKQEVKAEPVQVQEENKVYVVKATTPHSHAKTPEYSNNTQNVVVLDSAPKNQRVNLDDYKIMVTDEFLQTCYVDEVPSNKVIVATPTNVSSAKNINVDTSSLKVPEANNGAGSGSLLVSSNDEEMVQDILKKYSLKTENNTFMLSSENYKSFIRELKICGIPYRDYMIHSQKTNVAFQLIVS